ncbi:MAG: 4-hydroxy-3-methylbut-2-enyl diphosphate reductase [Actinobacteria bacterium RBG_19FT_COMBO_54_7]|uniref:4-hydroxy-3-methylbut-2-enyl diphosphate reductase n=1 Tax=Candidatus Solincola sediminis TaxID=1797199 RepID=A0A1F2WFN6_9ACTN|nr:MAG: 4-hydroxy-3-methylbut-2-enyl diphosphate reductase [Candidatus Solincola sediminis]OFW58093.1 MAG: 4-hydroxy-3-methylbut-2-enyl diphosphate reductase [Candidatus Solincola sediminis]OFW65820.1 MAG: 4-hydroxy-3-methylbut-2-enyl diphosphate reductase [Actinobacteria bacterium RBG_19FT_COMBO_54_7]
MEIAVAKHAGFCPGVKRAIRMAESELEKAPEAVCTLGPIIHNPHVVNELQERGIRILPDDKATLLKSHITGTHIVIRSHGISPDLQQLLMERGAHLVDATCPTVKKAQRAAIRLVKEGYNLFIVGNAEHPEVKAILGHIDGEAVVISEPHELKNWWSNQTRKVRKVGLIAQTTVDLFMFRNLVDELITEVPEFVSEVLEVKVINTLCRNTLARQSEAFQLALSSDFVLVLGGRNSSNTEFLRKICEITGTRTLKIETADELDLAFLEGVQRVAILGGASTPNTIVEEVRQKIVGSG